jgi:ABC-type dipeptide/oligopeptide/nickel transport system permease subunit
MIENLSYGIIYGFALSLIIGFLSWGIAAVIRIFKNLVKGE